MTRAVRFGFFLALVALRLPLFNGMHRFFGSLLLREGCHMVQVPVHHRLRFHGHSHYNFWNRSLQVVFDLLGVIWLINRPLCCQVVRLGESENRAMSVITRSYPLITVHYPATAGGGRTLVEHDIMVDDRFRRPGAFYRTVPDAMGGLGKETRFRCTDGVLVA